LRMGYDFAAFVFGRPARRQLPERVRTAIAHQQVQAEILTGWTQLALVLFFLALYTIARKPPDGISFHPVPWVLSAFLLFTLVRLALAYRRIIATWFLAGSVVAEIGVLLLLIWSFHIQYAQPAAFYLKAPTLLYVFLLIALRTLRFDPTYVIIAGVSAAVGWAVLVVLAITEPSLTSPVTRDYVLYLTSNRVLVGAEIDKILCILIVTAVLAVAIVRARRLLMKSVADATVARDLRRFVAPEVASQIAASERAIEPGDGEVLIASILFCDIEGFSTISERLGPDELMYTLNEYFAAVSEVVARYDGVLTAYQGDAMLIAFNTARPDPDHAAHALLTAIGIQQMVTNRTFGDGLVLKTRCGVNTGRLVAGAVGTPQRLLFTVYGDEVNIAARLEQLNKSFGTYILATEQTLAAAGRGFACRPMGSVQVRGRLQPVSVFAIDGLATAPAQSK
jgi:adenylate cyclase